jgi:hypothetical protein
VVAATSRIAEVLDVAIEMAVAEMAEEQDTSDEEDPQTSKTSLRGEAVLQLKGGITT